LRNFPVLGGARHPFGLVSLLPKDLCFVHIEATYPRFPPDLGERVVAGGFSR
jgi:hypothetical protein